MIEDDENWKQDLSRDEDYELAKSIVEELEREFAISIPQVEISYICLHLKGAKHEKIQWDSGQKQILENRELQQLVNDMIDAYDTKQAYLMKQDDGFIQGLLAHLQPTLIRLVYGMQIQNPVLEDIKVSYPDIYRRCENVAKVLKAYTGKEVPEQEIGFLTVHFGAAMVRLEGRQQKNPQSVGRSHLFERNRDIASDVFQAGKTVSWQNAAYGIWQARYYAVCYEQDRFFYLHDTAGAVGHSAGICQSAAK